MGVGRAQPNCCCLFLSFEKSTVYLFGLYQSLTPWRGLNEELVDDLMIIEEGLDVVTKFMRQNGLSTLERQPSGWTPMCYAALSGDTELVSALLQGRADAGWCFCIVVDSSIPLGEVVHT